MLITGLEIRCGRHKGGAIAAKPGAGGRGPGVELEWSFIDNATIAVVWMAVVDSKDIKNKTDERLIILSGTDNVAVARQAIGKGEFIRVNGETVRVSSFVGIGHKIALCDIAAGEKIRKYGVPIGSATAQISAGDHVHLHNLKSDYTATHSLDQAQRQHENKTRKSGL